MLFREHRDMAAAKAFFRSAQAATGVTPERVTTDGHDSYPRAIRTELGNTGAPPHQPIPQKWTWNRITAA